MLKLPKSEIQICSDIVETLNYTGKYYCWRVNSGAIPAQDKYGRTRMIRMAKPGTSDIQGLRKSDGRMICLEVKKPNTRANVTQLQANYLDMMSSYGAITGVATNAEEALAIIED